LVKKGAGIQKEKWDELKVLTVINGREASYDPTTNYFGQKLGTDFVYLSSNQIVNNLKMFDVYIKDGVPIPDFVLNCDKVGGSRTMINYWQNSTFPPSWFNTDQVSGSQAGLTAPAYVYDDKQTTVTNLHNTGSAVQNAGMLPVSMMHQSYEIDSHLGSAYLINGNIAYEYLPTTAKINIAQDARPNLQLKWFFFVETPEYTWFTPECKPAIYLYPEKEEQVAVKVNTTGKFTLTIPSYPSRGWDVTAEPDGTIHSGGQTYPYLYYESQIPDANVTKPQEGYVVAYNDLSGLYDTLLPKLGLNGKESTEFKDYWNKSLPYSPYYFVGVMPQKDIDAIEPMEITPAPQTTIRVRVYFEPLLSETSKSVTAPVIQTPERKGFTAVEWGGMVKLNKGENFTCSQ